MSKKIIDTHKAPAAIGTYSQAVVVDRMVFLSGQIGLIPETMQIAGQDVVSQAHQVFKNLQAVTQSAQSDFHDIVKLTVYLKDLSDFPQVNEIMASYFEKPYPARAAVEVARLPKDALIEIDAIIIKES